MIMNGVCVRWRGWLDLERLDGVACLEYDEERGAIEDSILREQMERYNSRMRELEERQRLFKVAQERQAEAEAERGITRFEDLSITFAIPFSSCAAGAVGAVLLYCLSANALNEEILWLLELLSLLACEASNALCNLRKKHRTELSPERAGSASN
ncbi:unnamed protein product [Medioppia subpectinata]|uniref:Protein big brother n=1 Tax=Medioppia subpectinata TaxID=1979941 RepID=A0A7R9KG14_9ACAR|nr:unnamed protein product [Medioppia subpectinata]CAG2102881.1 unnamed protein product [Medioppia subpectinata]